MAVFLFFGNFGDFGEDFGDTSIFHSLSRKETPREFGNEKWKCPLFAKFKLGNTVIQQPALVTVFQYYLDIFL